jgi:hypothetical protein
MPFEYYVPGHLPRRIDEYRKRLKTLAITFIQFSPDGTELLVNLGGEQLYSFVLNEDYSKSHYSLKHDTYRELLANLPEPATEDEDNAPPLPPVAESHPVILSEAESATAPLVSNTSNSTSAGEGEAVKVSSK